MTGPITGSPPSGPKARKASPFLKIERKITAGDGGGIMSRWHYGREALKARAGRKQLPDGMMANLIKEAGADGKKLSEREIRYRMKFASVYASDQQVCKIIADLGTWSEIIAAGFPSVEVDEEPDPEADIPAPDSWEQLSLLPGFKPTVKVHGREMPVADMTVPEAIAYRDKYRAMHEGFGKTLAQIEITVGLIEDGWDGDPLTKAVDAYRRAGGEDDAMDPRPKPPPA